MLYIITMWTLWLLEIFLPWLHNNLSFFEIVPSLKLIIWLTGVLRGTVAGDWRFDHQATYIGETGRNSTTLRNEDKRTTKNNSQNTT